MGGSTRQPWLYSQFFNDMGKITITTRKCQSFSLNHSGGLSLIQDAIPHAISINGPLPCPENLISYWSISSVEKPLETSTSLCSDNNFEQVLAEKRRRKHKSLEELQIIPNSNRRGRRKKQKCVVFRSAIAAAALSVSSISSGGIKNRNKLILNEEEAVRTVTKIVGEDYLGSDDEVLSNFMVTDSLEGSRPCDLDANPSL